jgi:beta-N-acetylhexosaminidase
VLELEALAGSLLCVGLPGPALAETERAALATLRPSAVVLFARNVSTLEATRTLVADARAAIGGDVPALVCVDQEGGRVRRLPFARDAMPSMLALGASGDADLARRAGVRLAAELRAVGANVDFAPVLDLACAAGTVVIGTRALGSDAREVGRMGAEFVRGMQSSGVAATAKHFPGHGATEADSHLALPVLAADAPSLRARELVPFAAAFAAGARAVMTAHIVVTALDDARPATLSPAILQTLLREELGFAGVCFTDCLEMAAIANGIGTARGAAAAIAAGADVALVSHDLALAVAARDAIVAAVRTGEIPIARLHEAAARVAALRVWAAAAAPVADVPADDLAREIARRATTIVRGDARLDERRPVTVISFEGDVSDGIAAAASERPSLSLALRRRRRRSELMRVVLDPPADVLESLLEIVRAQGDRQFVVLARRAHRYAAQQRALAALFALAPQSIAASLLEPFDLSLLAGARSVVCTHGDEEIDIDALADVLAGPAPAA